MDLNDMRSRIDEIDADIAKLFETRMELSEMIAQYKRSRLMPTLDAAREEEKLTMVSRLVGSQIRPYAAELFKEIMSLSKQYQNDIRSAYGD